MTIQKLTWRDAFAESSIPLVFSTIVHTAIFVVLALCVSVEQVATHSMIHASLADGQEAEFEVFDSTSLDAPLGESEQTGSIDYHESLLSLKLPALSETDMDSHLKLLVSSFRPPKESRLLASDPVAREAKNRERRVHQVYASTSNTSLNQRSLRFGGKSSPGARNIGYGPASTLQVIVPGLDPLGSRVLSQVNNLSLTGGAMMVSTAQPDPSIANVPLRFEYDATNIDGRRLVVIASKQRATLAIYDWELQPLAKFVDSGHHGAVSIHMSGRHEKVSLDAAFEQTLLGLRFIQADFMSRGIIMSQEYLPQDERGIIIGPGELERLSTDEEVASSVHELKPLMARTRNGASYSVLTDARVPFVFAIEGNELVISGTPYFFFWEPTKKGDQVVPKRSLNEALMKAWPQIKQANPLVIESMEKSFRAVALFRFQKQKSPDNWNEFMRQLSTVSLAQVPTPSLLSNQGD